MKTPQICIKTTHELQKISTKKFACLQVFEWLVCLIDWFVWWNALLICSDRIIFKTITITQLIVSLACTSFNHLSIMWSTWILVVMASAVPITCISYHDHEQLVLPLNKSKSKSKSAVPITRIRALLNLGRYAFHNVSVTWPIPGNVCFQKKIPITPWTLIENLPLRASPSSCPPTLNDKLLTKFYILFCFEWHDN